MKSALPTRRRFLGILAVSATLLGPASLRAATQTRTALPDPVIWRGVALGADAELQLLHPDRAHAQAMIDMAVAEVHRLERIFSLYREDSALVTLNRTGRLDEPPADLLRLLSQAVAFGRLTRGAFDPSVQPLWDLYADTLRQGRALPPGPDALREVLSRVDYRAIRLEEHAIVLERPGMALTLNGIAQGYITDRVTELLRANGLEHALIDLGETRTLGSPAIDRPWRAGIADPLEPARILETIELHDAALATSGGYGTPLDPAGHYAHLFDPHTGRATPPWRSVTVRAQDATTADALSTAFSLMTEDEVRGIISRLPIQTWLLRRDTDPLIRLG